MELVELHRMVAGAGVKRTPEIKEPGLGVGCAACPLQTKHRPVAQRSDFTKHRPDYGGKGGVLFVDGGHDNRAAQPFTGPTCGIVRKLADAHWKGTMSFAYAQKCAGRRGKNRDAILHACRGYLQHTIEQKQPTRILAFGPDAVYALLGRRLPPFSVRRGYGWYDASYGQVPVFYQLEIEHAFKNRFFWQWLLQDVAWALNVPRDALISLSDDRARITRTVGDARVAIERLREARFTAFDVETSGVFYTPGFRILSIAMTGVFPDESTETFVWHERLLEKDTVRTLVCDFLKDPNVRKVGQNVKFDVHLN